MEEAMLQRQWIDFTDPHGRSRVNKYMGRFRTHSQIVRKIAVLSKSTEGRRCSNCIKSHIKCNGRVPCNGCGTLNNRICLYCSTDKQSHHPIRRVGCGSMPVSDNTGSVRVPPGLVPMETRETWRRLPLLSTSRALQSGNADPFAASIIPLTAADHGLIILWRDWFVHKLWPCDAGVNYLPVLSQWSSLVSLAISRSSCAHALLAAASLPDNRKPTPVLDHRNPTGDKDGATRHVTLAMSALESDISLSVTDLGSVFTIWLLTSTALDFGDYATATIHLNGAKALLDDGRGLLMLPHVLRWGLIEDDHNLSMHSSRLPIFHEKHWDPGDILRTLRPSDCEQIQSSEYLCTPLSNCISASLSKVFHPYREICAFRNYALTIGGTARRTELLIWADSRVHVYFTGIQRRRCEAIKVREEFASRFTAQDSFESCVSIVLKYITRILFHPQHTEQDIWNDFEDIAESLCHSQVRSLIAPHLLLWILAVCAITEYKAVLANDRPVNAWWHVPRFLILAHSLNITSAEAISPVLRQFLYDRQLNCVLDAILNLGGPFNITNIQGTLRQNIGFEDAGYVSSDMTWNRKLVINTATTSLSGTPKRASRYHHDHHFYQTLMTLS